MIKYINILFLVLIIFIINPQESNAIVTPSNLKADSLFSQMEVSYPFSFVVMGDSQPYDGQLLNETFLDILLQVADMPISPTFVIICGDLTESGSEVGYLAYNECISDWMDMTGIPFYSLPGNHEFYGANAFEYYSLYIDPKIDYFFDYGNSRFIAINNVQHPDEMYYHITEAQLDSVNVWLNAGPENKFAFNHVSIVRDHHGGGFVNDGYQEFHGLLNYYGAVADFNGHHRDYDRDELEDVYYITTAGAGGDIEGTFYPPLSYNDHHWLLVTVNELNNIFIEMYFYEGGHNAIASLYDFQLKPIQESPSIYINEFMASNTETIADPQGDFDDWIEIYNADIYPVNVGGMYITDDLSDPAKWRIPNTQPDSTTIQPGEFLLLWADEDIDDGILHLDIRLSVTGEEIGIYTDDLTSNIDSIIFGAQYIDFSFGRDPDGTDNWIYIINPTPGYSNNYIPIEVNFSADPLSGSVPLEVQFTDSSIGNITSWEWDFDNDGTIDNNEQNPLFTYSDTGIYTISLTVSDGITSETETKNEYIEVIIALDADFTANPISGIFPLEVEFTSNSTGDIISWEWDFDNDGTIDSTEESPIYTYTGAGIYSVSLTISDGSNSDTEVKIDYIEVTGTGAGDDFSFHFTELHQNHPNPFNPTTNIQFDIMDNEAGVLTIFNIKGQIMISQSFNFGRHDFIWNANNCSSGIYFYKLETESFTETKKMLLLK